MLCVCAALTWSMRYTKPQGAAVACRPPNLGEMHAELESVCGCLKPFSGRQASGAQVCVDQPLDDDTGQV